MKITGTETNGIMPWDGQDLTSFEDVVLQVIKMPTMEFKQYQIEICVNEDGDIVLRQNMAGRESEVGLHKSQLSSVIRVLNQISSKQ